MKKILFVLAMVLCCGIFISCNKQKALNKPITQNLTNDECDQFTKMFENDFNVNSVDVVGEIHIEDSTIGVKGGFVKHHKTFGEYFNEVIQDEVNDLLNTSTSDLSTNDKIVIEKLNTITYKNVYAFFKEKEILEFKLWTTNKEWIDTYSSNSDNYEEIWAKRDKIENKYVKEPLKRVNEDMWWMYYVYEWNVFYVLEENVHPYMKK